MIVSYSWLQSYFKTPLPEPKALGLLLNTRAFEIEAITPVGADYAIDVDVQPNRAHDCLCHRGIAQEIAVLTKTPYEIPVRSAYTQNAGTSPFFVHIADGVPCLRYMSVLVEGVVVGQANTSIVDRLTTLGQRSINAVVDSVNYSMFEVGQPLHAFDADKITGTTIFVRYAKPDETATTLDGKEITFTGSEVVIADEAGVLAIAGIKGCVRAEVTKDTTRILLEAASFDASYIRKTSAMLGISTDASKRFERGLSPLLVERGIQDVLGVLTIHAPTPLRIFDTVDVYPRPHGTYKTGVSRADVEAYLGIPMDEQTLEQVLTQLGYTYTIVDPAAHVVEHAVSLVGTVPYKHGASVTCDAPRAFDCSSFTAYLFKEAGISIPRVTVDQYMWGTPVTADELQPGDIVFCNLGASAVGADKQFYYSETVDFMKGTPVPEKLDHNGVYIGNGEVVHASSKAGNTVARETLADSVIFSHIVGYRRMAPCGVRRYAVTVPDERLDIRIPADLIEEIARVYGYENIAPKPLANPEPIVQNAEYTYLNHIRSVLKQLGFSEIMTPTFVATGDIQTVKAIASDKAFLRTNLRDNVRAARALNEKYIDLLAVDRVRIFEIGHVFTHDAESLRLAIAVSGKKADAHVQTALEAIGCVADIQDGIAEVVLHIPHESVHASVLETNLDTVYKPFSVYPYIVRDIAVWVPKTVSQETVEAVIRTHATELCVLNRLFDVFEKDERVSYAFRLVFQSPERTLTDAEVEPIMQAMSTAYQQAGFEVR